MLNQTLIVNGYPMTIVGVAHKGFMGERLGEGPNLYVPVTMKSELSQGWKSFDDHRDYWITLLARLKPGISIRQAEGAINTVYRGQLEIDEKLLHTPKPDFLARFRAKKIILKPGDHGRGGVRDESKEPLTLLMGITFMVLLIACANEA